MRDLIYFDVDKASSLLSQFEGGLLREVQESEADTGADHVGLQASLAIFKAEIGAGSESKSSRVETRVLHHSLLNRLEALLDASGLLVDLPTADLPASVADARDSAVSRPYVRAEGWAVIEDFERLKELSQKINSVLELTRKSARYTLEQSEPYKNLRALIESQKKVADDEPNREKRTALRSQAKAQEAQTAKLLDSVGTLSSTDRLPEWLIEGIKFWVDSFNSKQIHLRLFPFGDRIPFQLLANLKRSCFVDSDLEHVLFSYGKRPTVKLGVVALVTSAPELEGSPMNMMAEFVSLPEGQAIPEAIAIERSFRTAFEGIDALDRMMRFSRYPIVTVFPIAVFRSIATPTGEPQNVLPTGRSNDR